MKSLRLFLAVSFGVIFLSSCSSENGMSPEGVNLDLSVPGVTLDEIAPLIQTVKSSASANQPPPSNNKSNNNILLSLLNPGGSIDPYYNSYVTRSDQNFENIYLDLPTGVSAWLKPLLFGVALKGQLTDSENLNATDLLNAYQFFVVPYPGLNFSYLPSVAGEFTIFFAYKIEGVFYVSSLANIFISPKDTPVYSVDTYSMNIFPSSIANIEDIDGDSAGIADLLIGGSEKITVVSGKDGSVIVPEFTEEPGTVSYFGRRVAAGGDVNADSIPDFIVGAERTDVDTDLDGNFEPDIGKAYVYSVINSNLYLLRTWQGDANDKNFGLSVATAGDVDGDGREDALIGSETTLTNGNKHGAVHVYSGGPANVRLDKIIGPLPDDRFGAAVATIDDLNGDGVAEFAVGAPNTDCVDGLYWCGAVYLYDGAFRSVYAQIDGEEALASFGSSLASLTDITGDGINELIVGAVPAGGSLLAGGDVFVYSGSDLSLVYSFGQENEYLGFSVADAGDVDGDGITDILIGGKTNNSVRVYSGANGNVIYDYTLDPYPYGGPYPSGYGFGVVGGVAGLGDVNGDGLADFASVETIEPYPFPQAGIPAIYRVNIY